MARLADLIKSVQGVGGGNSFEMQKRLYQALGSPKGTYRGDYNQNVFLLDQIKRKNFGSLNRPAPAPITAPAPISPFDALKQQALSDPSLQRVKAFEQVNPFTNFFNEGTTRDSLKQLFRPEFNRVNNQASEVYQQNQGNLNQRFANQGTFFGGARQRNLMDLTKQNTDQTFLRDREQNRMVEDRVLDERSLKQKEYEDEKTRYLKNPQYIK